MKEKIIETKVCKQCNTNFEITDKDLEFYDKISPIFNGEKFNIPSPKLCPDCRKQRRLSFRNERKLYTRKCDATWKQIISIYSPDKPFKVFNQEFWWSNKWDTMDYWMDYNFSKTFFEQYKTLTDNVPKVSLISDYINNENSAYTNYAWSNKNCYLAFDSDFNEDCINITSSTKNKNCIDCLNTHNSEICYECTWIEKSYKCFFWNNLINCSESYFCQNLVWCKDCFWCSNLENKQYCINNIQFTKEEYYDLILEHKKNTNINFDILEKSKDKSITTIGSQNFNWNYIYNSDNIFNSSNIYDSRDSKYCFWLHDSTDCYDVDFFWFNWLNHVYDSHVIWNGGKNILFWNSVVNNNSNIYYSENIYNNSSNIFWCFWLDNKEYCILNKQYTKEEYEKVVPKIIKQMEKKWEWWEFFSSNISPFWYNETTANDYFPLNKKEIQDKWFNWLNFEQPVPKVEKIIPANKLPNNISDIPDDILNWAIKCIDSNKPFRITKKELKFYRKYNLPIPKRHPDIRYLNRIKLRKN